jgi:hypothetical protein
MVYSLSEKKFYIPLVTAFFVNDFLAFNQTETRGSKISVEGKTRRLREQGCQIFIGATYQNWEKYTKKTTKLSK